MAHPQPGCVCVNGILLEPGAASVSVFDAGFLLGDGLFESLRAVNGAPYLLDRHLGRLYAAAQECEFANMPSRETVAGQVRMALERSALQDAYVRVTVTRGVGGIGLAPPSGPPTVVIAVLPAPVPPTAEAGIVVALLRATERRASAKSTSRQQTVLARRRVERLGAGEGLYVSEDGHVLEGLASNLFVVHGRRLATPCTRECLPGITRARVLELARVVGIEVLEAPVEVDALMRAEEVFVTNAVQGLRAVRAVDRTPIRKASADGILRTLFGLYEQDRLAMERADGSALPVERKGGRVAG